MKTNLTELKEMLLPNYSPKKAPQILANARAIVLDIVQALEYRRQKLHYKTVDIKELLG